MRQNVDSIGRLDGFVGKVQQSAARDDPRIVDQNVNFTNFDLHALGYLVDLVLVRNVDGVDGAIETLVTKRIRIRFDRCKKCEEINASDCF